MHAIQAVASTSQAKAALERTDERGNTALIVAIQRGQADLVKALMMAGANPWTSDENSTKALPLAIELGHMDIARELFRNPKSSRNPHIVNARDDRGTESLFLALEADMEDLACSLIQAGAILNIHLNGKDFLPYAIEGGHHEACIQAILACSAKCIFPNPLNESDASGRRAFEIALEHDPFIAQALIDAGCNMSFDFKSNDDSAKNNAARAGLRIVPDPSRIPSAATKNTPTVPVQTPEPPATIQDPPATIQDPRLPGLISLARVAAKARANAQDKIDAAHVNSATPPCIKL